VVGLFSLGLNGFRQRGTSVMFKSVHQEKHLMSMSSQPNIRLLNAPDYRDGYANSVQVRVSVWDFFLIFGRLQPQSPEQVEVHNFQGIYLSPQQAKALMTILEQNVAQYEKTFGEIKLEPGALQPGTQIN
jgi:hypothetical protein